MDLPILLIIIAVFFIIVFGIILVLLSKSSQNQTVKWKEDAKKHLSKLNSLYGTVSADTGRNLIIDADKLLDYALKNKGLKGETMGERLKSAKSKYNPNLYNNIWEAHKIRNKLVHELNYNPGLDDLKFHYRNLKKGIEEIIK